MSADPRHFRQVISNAHRYGSDPVRIRDFVDDDAYIVEVLDSGDGVSAGEEATLFNRYVHEGILRSSPVGWASGCP